MNIGEFFKWINNIEKSTFSLNETNTNFICEVLLTKERRGLYFNLIYPNIGLLYNNNSNFLLKDNHYQIRVNNFIHYQSSILERKCNIYIFESICFSSEIELYHKYYSRVDGDLSAFYFLEEISDKISITVNENIYNVSIILNPYLEERYLIIESLNPLKFSVFQHEVNAIIIGIGFISGFYYRLEEYYFQSDNVQFNSIDFFCRYSDKKSVIYEPISNFPSSYYYDKNIDESDLDKYRAGLSIDNFTRLINLFISKHEIYISVVNMFKIYNVYPLFTLSALFVILETICEQINKEFASEYQDKIQVKQKGLKVLKEIKAQISDENHNQLTDIINQIDSKLIENIINYERACNAIDVKLSNEERKAIKKRNELFHGRIIPIINKIDLQESHTKIEMEYSFYADRIYVVIAKLILKKIGFSGFILNHPKIREKETGKSLNEPHFIKI